MFGFYMLLAKRTKRINKQKNIFLWLSWMYCFHFYFLVRFDFWYLPQWQFNYFAVTFQQLYWFLFKHCSVIICLRFFLPFVYRELLSESFDSWLNIFLLLFIDVSKVLLSLKIKSEWHCFAWECHISRRLCSSLAKCSILSA